MWKPQDYDSGDFETEHPLLRPHLRHLRAALNRLSGPRQIAFAACCAERLYPDYRSLAVEVGLEDQLRPLIDGIWRHALGRPLTGAEVEAGCATCLELPLGEEGCCFQQGCAENAVDAVIHALEACREPGVARAICAAGLPIESIYQELWEVATEKAVSTIFSPEDVTEIDREILEGERMAAEFALQFSLVDALEGHGIDRDRLHALVQSAQPIGDWPLYP